MELWKKLLFEDMSESNRIWRTLPEAARKVYEEIAVESELEAELVFFLRTYPQHKEHIIQTISRPIFPACN